jgi:mRNA interferase MazF
VSAPSRGELWLVDFSPARGSEQAGLRPALVIQNNVGNRHAGTTIVSAVTTTIRPFPVTVVVEKGEAGLQRRSMINLSQILTIDRDRLTRHLGTLSPPRMHEVDEAIRVSLDV